MQYAATLIINTKKYVLEKYDDGVRSKSERKLLGTPHNHLGIFLWISYFALESGFDNMPISMGVPTQIGMLKQKSKVLKDWINFLIYFRTVS